MQDLLKKLSKPLSVDQIDFRIQSINKGGYATILAYKDARVDMQRLDEVVGPMNWQRKHARDNHNCVIEIWCHDKKQWVSKEDTGTESYTEKEKGLASDSFKRAGFNWGIGRELYDYPLISVKLTDKEFYIDNGKAKQSWDLRLRDWKWFSQFNEDNTLTILMAKDQNGKVRYEWRNIILVQEMAAVLLGYIENEEYELLGEAYSELEEWEEVLLNTAITKGGFFTQEQKQIISTATQQFLNPTGENK